VLAALDQRQALQLDLLQAHGAGHVVGLVLLLLLLLGLLGLAVLLLLGALRWAREPGGGAGALAWEAGL
jgi:hypothetical protein